MVVIFLYSSPVVWNYYAFKTMQLVLQSDSIYLQLYSENEFKFDAKMLFEEGSQLQFAYN